MARPPSSLSSKLELKPSDNGLTVASLDSGDEGTQTSPRAEVPPVEAPHPVEATLAGPEPVTPKQLEDFRLWATGRLGPVLKTFGLKGLRAAGLEPPPPVLRRPDYLEEPEDRPEGPGAPPEPKDRPEGPGAPPEPGLPAEEDRSTATDTAAPGAAQEPLEPSGDPRTEDPPALASVEVREGPRVIDPDPPGTAPATCAAVPDCGPRGAGTGPLPPAPTAPSRPPRPPRPDRPRDHLAAAAALTTAWATLMARAQGAATPPPPSRRGEVGGAAPGRVIAGVFVAAELVRAFAQDGAEATLGALVDCLSTRWRDWKPATRAYWRSGLAELRTGLLTADEVCGLVTDSDRREVKARAHYFSHHLGAVLADKRRSRGAGSARARDRPPAAR